MNRFELRVGQTYTGNGPSRRLSRIEADLQLASGTRAFYEPELKRKPRRQRSCCILRFAAWAKRPLADTASP